MGQYPDLHDLKNALDRDWSFAQGEGLSEAELRQFLTEQVAELISNDFERLAQIMYRLDVDETKFAAALSTGLLVEQAAAIADLVIQREIQRLEFRRRFSSSSSKQT